MRKVHRQVVAAEALHSRSEAHNAGLRLRHRAVPRLAARTQIKAAGALLAGLNGDVALAVHHHHAAAAFVECVLRIRNQMRMLARHPLCAKLAASFLVGQRQKNHVALERLATCHALLEQQQAHQVCSNRVLHVHCPAPKDLPGGITVAGEWRMRPLVWFRRHNIHVPHQQQRRQAAIALEPRNKICAPGRRLQN